MAALLTRLLLIAVLLVSAVSSQDYEGDACTYQLTGLRGVCTPLRTCIPAKRALKNSIFPQTCSYQGTSPVVCCPSDEDALPAVTWAPRVETPMAAPATMTAPPSIVALSWDRCPPVPADAVKVQPTGQKAWDKCIELAQSVYPCVPSSFLVNSPKIRRNSCSHVSTPLIVGGSPTTAGEFPHMALLGFGKQPDIKWDCGGTLISERWVLTAGHCTFTRDYGELTLVRLGGGDVDSIINLDNLYTLANTISHPEHSPSNSIYNDIALLQLDREVIFTSLIRPACLHTGQAVNDTKAIATGWGTIKPRGDKSNSLLKVTLEKFSHADCKLKNPASKRSLNGVMDATQICFGHRTEAMDTCQGDSGGPLQLYNDVSVYCTYLLIGVTSYGKTCGVRGQPAIYTRVSAFIPWIESVVWP